VSIDSVLQLSSLTHAHCNTLTVTAALSRQTLLGRDNPFATTAAAASPLVAEFSEQIARLSELVIDAKALVHHTRHFFDAYAQLHREGASSRGEAIRGLDSQCYQVCYHHLTTIDNCSERMAILVCCSYAAK
jgi:hypothetical protein